MLSSDQWRQVRSSALAVGDHLLLHEVCAALVPDRVLAASDVPFRHPCVLLSINSDASAGAGAGCCFQKIPPGHHESQKIRTFVWSFFHSVNLHEQTLADIRRKRERTHTNNKVL